MRGGPFVLAAVAGLVLAGAAGAAEPPRVYALTNARIVPAPGKAVERGTIVVRGGLIEAVGLNAPVPADAAVLDLDGKTVYAGLIDPYVTLSRLAGKKPAPEEPDEDDATPRRRAAPAPAEPPSNAYPAVAGVRPDVSALDGLKLSPEAVEGLRSLGFAAVGAVPDEGIFRGDGAVVSLGGRPLAESVLVGRTGPVVLPEPARRRGEGYPTSKMGSAALVRQLFLDARWLLDATTAYERKPEGQRRPERLEAWAALGPAASGKEPVTFETPDVLALLRYGRIAKELDLKARFVGAPDAYRLADEVKALAPELILPLAFPPVPSVPDEDDWLDVPLETLRLWDRAPSNPRWMRDLGLGVALTTHGLKELADLPRMVRRARARGLTADDVLAGFTTVPARMLGLAGRLGEIAPGRVADLVVVSGRLFEERSRVVQTWVDGVPYEVVAREEAPSGRFRVEGVLVEFRKSPRSAVPSVHLTPASGGESVDGADVTRHEGALAFTVDGAALGLAPGPVRVRASSVGESLTLAVTRGEERLVKRGEKAPPPEGGDGPGGDGEGKELPDSDVRPLPARFAAPLAEPKAVLVRGAEVWTEGPAGILTKGDVLVVDGKVAAVGPSVTVPPLLAASVLEVDGAGKVVTPGLVDEHSHTAIDGNVNESGRSVSAEVRVADTIDPFDVALYRELAGGLTAAHLLHGSSNAIGGQDAVVKLAFGRGPDALPVASAPAGIKFALGENPKQSYWQLPVPRYPQTRMGVSALVRERFAAARDYRRKQKEAEAARARGESPVPVRTDLQLEAIAEILEGKRIVHAHAYVKQEILDLIRTCKEYGVRIGTFEHALDAYKVADEIAAHGAGASVFSDWWAYKLEVFDAIPTNAALLRERGVVVSLNSDSDELARRLALESAKTVRYGGVPRQEALAFVTRNPAKQLGLSARIGSLENGKDGDFAIWSGDPLDPRSLCLETWIEGRKYFDRAADLEGRQLLLAEKADLVARAERAASRGHEKAPGASGGKPPETGCLGGGNEAGEARP